MSQKIYYGPLLRLACACYLIGVWVSPWRISWGLIGLACCLVAVAMFFRKVIVVCLIGMVLAGFLHYRGMAFRMGDVEPRLFKEHQFHGEVFSYGKKQQMGFVHLIRLSEGGKLIELRSERILQFGDSVLFICYLAKPEPSPIFNRQLMLWNKGAIAACTSHDVAVEGRSGWSWRFIPAMLRHSIIATIERILPGDEGGLYRGILLGDVSGLSKETQAWFKDSGMTHVMAVSGFNVSLMIALMSFAAQRASLARGRKLLLSMLGIFLLWGMVGNSASVIRASMMGGVCLIAVARYRYANQKTIALLAATIMTIANPFALRSDIGFQLSFVATYALIAWTGCLERLLLGVGKKSFFQGMLSGIALPALIAYSSTAPLIWWHFKEISWTAIAANILLSSCIPILMGVGLIGAGVSMVFPWMGALCSSVMGFCAKVFLGAVHWFSRAEQCIGLREYVIYLFYGLLMIALVIAYKKSPVSELTGQGRFRGRFRGILPMKEPTLQRSEPRRG